MARRREAAGEYRIESRANSESQEWMPVLDMDPVPDFEDQATEGLAQAIRDEVARLNRQAKWYKYRTAYVFYKDGSPVA